MLVSYIDLYGLRKLYILAQVNIVINEFRMNQVHLDDKSH